LASSSLPLASSSLLLPLPSSLEAASRIFSLARLRVRLHESLQTVIAQCAPRAALSRKVVRMRPGGNASFDLTGW
jgi:hypothetical protein